MARCGSLVTCGTLQFFTYCSIKLLGCPGPTTCSAMARSQTIPQTASQTIIDSSLTVCRIVVIAVAVITEFIDPPTPARSSGIINLADTRQQLGLAGASVL